MLSRRCSFRFIIAALATILLPLVLHAQVSFERAYGGADYDGGYSGRQTADGGYIIAGAAASFCAVNSDLYLVKTNAIGEPLWTHTFGGDTDECAYSVQPTADGGYVAAGLTYSFGAGSGDVYLVKTDADGDSLWTRTCGGDTDELGRSVRQTTDSGYIIAGYSYSFGAGGEDVYLIKTDANGDTLWTRTFGGAQNDFGYSVWQTTDGGYVVAGGTRSYGAGGWDVYLIKTDADGDTAWTRTYGGDSTDVGYSVQQTTDGGYIIAGNAASFGAGDYDVYLIKTDGDGDTMWTKTIGGANVDRGYSVQQTTDGGYVVAGFTTSFGSGLYDAYVVRTDAYGVARWNRTFGGDTFDVGNSIQQTADGGYAVTGYTYSFGAGQSDAYLIKTDSLGNVGLAEHDRGQQVTDWKLAATVVRSLPQGATVFDASGRRVLHPKPGICFLRTTATAASQKVLLVK